MESEEQEKNENSMVEVESRVLKRVRKRLVDISNKRFRPSAVFLSIGMGSLGGIFGALISGVTTNSSYWWIYYVIAPIFATFSLVVYFFWENNQATNSALIAKTILEELTDPDHLKGPTSEKAKLAGVWTFESVTNITNNKSSGNVIIKVRQGQITVSGNMYGKEETLIGQIESLFCDFFSDRNQFILIYRLSSFNYDSTLYSGTSLFSGIILLQNEKNLIIKGLWHHLYDDPVSGILTFTKT